MSVNAIKNAVIAMAADALAHANRKVEARDGRIKELEAEVERLRARFEYIEEHTTTQGGGKGFTITCFVPADDEDIRCGIDAAIESHSKAEKERT